MFAPLTSAALGLATVALPLSAQEPPDSLRAPPDSAQVAPDSLTALDAQPDSVSPDTIFYNLPEMDPRPPPGFATGVWEWDREGIMASGANTLAELVAEVPGVIALWGGDYGTPIALSAFGTGGGGYRVFRDGFESYPLEGGVPDLQRIPLVGISRVRLDRSLGRMTIELWSLTHDDGRPLSVVEAGTGDLDTNSFRGVYADPTSLGGSLAVGLERADTRGIAPAEGGNRTGTWVRYQLHLRDRAGVAVDFRSNGSSTKVPAYAPKLSRSELVVRGRVRLAEGFALEAYTGRSTLDAHDSGPDFSVWGGTRRQHGVRLAVDRGRAWGRAAARLYGGDDLLERDVGVDGGVLLGSRGGVAAGYGASTWAGSTLSSRRVQGWLGPIGGLSVFGAWESGRFGSRDAPVLDGVDEPDPPFLPQPVETPPGVAVTERSTARLGAGLEVRGVQLSGALLRVDADVHLPLGTDLDAGALPVSGADRTGFEAWASVPTPLAGLRLEGAYQRFEDEGPYLPPQVYRGAFTYHRVLMESGNLELWWSLGVRGHDPMQVFVADESGEPTLAQVPFYQSWFARAQVRVVTVRVFVGWDNATRRRDLQNFPGRELPFARSFFGLRWDMWN